MEEIDRRRENGPNLEAHPLPPEILWAHIVNPCSAEWTALQLNGPLATVQMCVTRITPEFGTQSSYYADYKYAKVCDKKFVCRIEYILCLVAICFCADGDVWTRINLSNST